MNLIYFIFLWVVAAKNTWVESGRPFVFYAIINGHETPLHGLRFRPPEFRYDPEAPKAIVLGYASSQIDPLEFNFDHGYLTTKGTSEPETLGFYNGIFVYGKGVRATSLDLSPSLKVVPTIFHSCILVDTDEFYIYGAPTNCPKVDVYLWPYDRERKSPRKDLIPFVFSGVWSEDKESTKGTKKEDTDQKTENKDPDQKTEMETPKTEDSDPETQHSRTEEETEEDSEEEDKLGSEGDVDPTDAKKDITPEEGSSPPKDDSNKNDEEPEKPEEPDHKEPEPEKPEPKEPEKPEEPDHKEPEREKPEPKEPEKPEEPDHKEPEPEKPEPKEPEPETKPETPSTPQIETGRQPEEHSPPKNDTGKEPSESEKEPGSDDQKIIPGVDGPKEPEKQPSEPQKESPKEQKPKEQKSKEQNPEEQKAKDEPKIDPGSLVPTKDSISSENTPPETESINASGISTKGDQTINVEGAKVEGNKGGSVINVGGISVEAGFNIGGATIAGTVEGTKSTTVCSTGECENAITKWKTYSDYTTYCDEPTTVTVTVCDSICTESRVTVTTATTLSFSGTLVVPETHTASPKDFLPTGSKAETKASGDSKDSGKPGKTGPKGSGPKGSGAEGSGKIDKLVQSYKTGESGQFGQFGQSGQSGKGGQMEPSGEKQGKGPIGIPGIGASESTTIPPFSGSAQTNFWAVSLLAVASILSVTIIV